MQRGRVGGGGGGPGGGSYDGKIAGLYDLESTLGRGHFAVVKLARHVFTGEKVAVKVIDKSKLDEVSRAHLFQEVRCMKLVQHPNVVRLYEVIDTQTKLYLILELGDGGDLYDYIMRHEGTGLSEQVARDYFSQIVRAIAYCHRLHVVHRDLKPENVVFFERLGVVKLTDFGFSNRFYPGQKLETSCGSLAYSAPEILLGDSYDAPAVDVWSLGVILYMLVCGQAPFQEANDSETLTMIMDCKYSIPSHVSEPCRRLISRMLVREPEKRATLTEITNDAWLMEVDQPAQELAMPLVSRHHLSDDDHTLILQKMINGKIATKEEVLEALDKNEYNHITATYFLLAERKLRSHEQPKAQPKSAGRVPLLKVDSCGENETVPAGKTNQTLLSMSRTPGDIAPRARKCSIVTEECDDEEEEEECGVGGAMGGGIMGGDHSHSSTHSLSLNRRGSRSEGKLNLAVQELRREAALNVPISIISEASTAPEPLSPATSAHKAAAAASAKPAATAKTLPAPLATALSSPQLGVGGGGLPLKEVASIKEIGLKDIAEDSTKVSSPRGGFVGYEQRRGKFRKTRTASCSSSDASDEDSEGRKKRAAAGSNKSLHRSRDFQDPGGSGGGGGGEGGGGGGGNSGGGNNNGGGSLGGGSENIPPDGEAGGKEDSTNESGGGRRQCFNGGGGRPHRRRAGETRLRESQSLNRITEVQEAPEMVTATPTLQQQQQATPPQLPKAPPPSPTPGCGSGGDMVAATNRSKRSNALIGRYLNLQRKLCGMPLWGGGGGGGKQHASAASRLCKGGAGVGSGGGGGGGGGVGGGGGRKDINHSTAAAAVAVAASIGMCCHLHIGTGTTQNKCCHLC